MHPPQTDCETVSPLRYMCPRQKMARRVGAAPTPSSFGDSTALTGARRVKTGAVGGNCTRAGSLATTNARCYTTTAHHENCRAGTQCRHMRHSNAFPVFLPGTQQRTNTFTPADCRRRHGIFKVDVSVFRAHLPRSPSIVILSVGSFDLQRDAVVGNL